MSDLSCSGKSHNCPSHFHDDDPEYWTSKALINASNEPEASRATASERQVTEESKAATSAQTQSNKQDAGLRRVIRNFTPSWFIITMSTGALSIMLHQIPYHAHWLNIVSEIFFVLNVVLFLLFTMISVLRYTMFPQLILVVLHHPHQSLFLAAFPVGLATIINMIVLVCVPAWGKGLAILAWTLWWIDSVLALATCFHLTWVIMTNRRHELAEMTALYLIPIVATVIAATSGALVAGALKNNKHQLWTLVLSYIFWGIGTPLSWIILTMYFLRMTIHKPLQREVIVSLLLPIGPLSLSGFSLIALGKIAKHNFPLTVTIPQLPQAGDSFYLVGLIVGIVLWGFSLIWFVVAVIMIVTTYPFPFNMGWWGFIFPVGVFTLLTISIGEEFEFRFFNILSCVLTGICVLMWFFVAVETVKGVINGKMLFAPCLGTNLFQERSEVQRIAP